MLDFLAPIFMDLAVLYHSLDLGLVAMNCTPAAVVMGIVSAVSIGTTIAGAAVQSEGMKKQAEAQADAAQREADAAEERAKYLKRQKALALIVGSEQAQAYERRGARTAQSIGSLGDLSPDQAAMLQAQARYQAALDARTTRVDAVRKIWGIDIEERNMERVAQGKRIQAGEIEQASVLGQTGLALSTTGSVVQQAGSYLGGFKYSEPTSGNLIWQSPRSV